MSLNIFHILAIFWLIRTVKIIFFYLYLWQLKEYHIGRFFDHFRTEKGKKTLFHKLNFSKILLLFYFLSFPYFLIYLTNFPSLNLIPFISPKIIFLVLYYLFPFLLLVLYLFEGLRTFLDFAKKRIKIPVITKKMIFLIFSVMTFEVGVIFSLLYFEKDLNFFAFWLLIFDLSLPLIITVIVLIFQPFAVLSKCLIIRKAKRKREIFKNLLVIGITGSYGKTSTKEFLYTILSRKFNVLKTKEHQNSEIGISQCILKDLKPEHEIFIVEMGAYGRGGIKLLCDIVKPKIGILTGINEQHLALFGSQKNIIRAKYELIEALPDNGLAIFNGDNKYCLDLYDKTEKPKKISSSQPKPSNFVPDIWAENVIVQKNYVFFKACTLEECIDLKVYLSGDHFISNLLATIYVAQELGMKTEKIVEGCFKIESAKNTMNLFKGINGLIIIDDSYSANPEGVIAALDYLKVYGGRKMIIMPCLIELGRTAKEMHNKIGEKIGETCDAVIVTTKDYFREIGEGFLKKGKKEENVLFSEDPKEIFEIIKKFWGTGDIVLLEGRVPKKLIDFLVNSK